MLLLQLDWRQRELLPIRLSRLPSDSLGWLVFKITYNVENLLCKTSKRFGLKMPEIWETSRI